MRRTNLVYPYRKLCLLVDFVFFVVVERIFCVFEVIASHEDVEERDICYFDMENSARQQSRELMNELRMILADRATEFAARERRALAVFYGMSDAELDALEESQKSESRRCPEDNESRTDADLTKAPASDTFYEFSNQNEPFTVEDESNSERDSGERHARTLPSDLLAALRLRSVAEQTIGDDED
ncbi:hypothetical protein NECAME_07440 [Necator americanus]|uniref:Uncharacterized protein n=1 Tax=Necator americanus TaxID=51031 RepID=W2TQN0_NECAM|nr:hypothetical protein NECAME_07440 [Necator americanus]ETN83322.1 hypothetical protein NECAME_07440 [Necator americanus]